MLCGHGFDTAPARHHRCCIHHLQYMDPSLWKAAEMCKLQKRPLVATDPQKYFGSADWQWIFCARKAADADWCRFYSLWFDYQASKHELQVNSTYFTHNIVCSLLHWSMCKAADRIKRNIISKTLQTQTDCGSKISTVADADLWSKSAVGCGLKILRSAHVWKVYKNLA